jgi:hypothetical protein
VITDFLRKIIPKRFRPIGYIEHLVSTGSDGRVAKGPFAGMQYIAGAVGSAYVPKLLGIYERELNSRIEQACALGFPLIIDIGAAEGYYAVGLARRNPKARVIAFEMEAKGQSAMKEMALLNDVSSRVEVRGKCGLEDLQAVLQSATRSLIVCDVEGDEETLLNPDVIPGLSEAHLLVEMHDFIHPGITERMTRKFDATHEVHRIWQEPRTRLDFPYRTVATALLPGHYLNWAVSEWRPVQMSWLWMEPR